MKIRNGIPLAEFAANDDDAAIPAERMQLLRRGVVMASKGLMAEMLSDLRQAYRGDQRPRISAGERQQLIAAMDANYVVEGVLDDRSGYRQAIQGLARDCPAGADAVRALIAGLWRICKERRIPARTRWDRLRVLATTAAGFLAAPGGRRAQRRGEAA